ncbi:hypothetical protein MHEL_44720 [Mycolicibacterium helvum]|uniref:Uncharacterized protein n=1 Tax=Mycolicibacterium helvum TaxID=1534349 RepID=A0A7I7TCP6_9MYCO|nr:hypothetical protein MHEL_44720 [Mycolicibacterium helvum]
MQPRTPTREVTGLVNGYGAFTVPVPHRHHSEEIDGQLSLPAPDTCPHRSFGTAMRSLGSRSLALDHGIVYRHRATAKNHPWLAQSRLGSGSADPGDQPAFS